MTGTEPDRTGQGLTEQVLDALDRRLERNYGDTLGGITSVVVGDIDIPTRKVARELSWLADRDDAELAPGDLRIERRRNAGKNLQHWRVTRVEGGEGDDG